MGVRDFPAGGLADRGRAWLDAGSPEGPPARQAATVQLVRDAAHGDGIEVFCIERVASMAFAPSVLVFPGGGVDARDTDSLHAWGPDDREWSRLLGIEPEAASAIVVAAARELFEECGVLLASSALDHLDGPGPSPTALVSNDRPDDPREAGPVVDGRTLAAERAALVAGESLADVLTRRGLGLRGDLLRPVARWVTPHFEGRRYDTFFFRTAVPAGQEPDGQTTEAASVRWVRPSDALAGFEAGTVRLLPPTIAAFEDLARHATAAEALGGQPEPVRLVAPELVETGEGLVIRVDPW